MGLIAAGIAILGGLCGLIWIAFLRAPGVWPVALLAAAGVVALWFGAAVADGRWWPFGRQR